MWSIHNSFCINDRVLDITLWDTICKWLTTGQWFSPGILVSSTKKNYCHDITEIFLKIHYNPNLINEWSIEGHLVLAMYNDDNQGFVCTV
jgi:hypothetical protein